MTRRALPETRHTRLTPRQERWLLRLALIERTREALGPFAWRLLVSTPYALLALIGAGAHASVGGLILKWVGLQ